MQDKKMYESKKGASSPFNNSAIQYQFFSVFKIFTNIPVYQTIKDLLICFPVRIAQYSQ